MADIHKLQFNNRTILTPSRDSFVAFTESEPLYPSDMDFIYLAKDFDGSKIPNKALNSSWGDYLKHGTISLNGTGSAAYLTSTHNDNDYLYIDLTNEQRAKVLANTSAFTYFIRMIADTSGVGGVFGSRLDGNKYNYMIRCSNGNLQLHTTSAVGFNGSNFSMLTDNVLKLYIIGSTAIMKNLSTNVEETKTITSTRNMGNRFATFYAGYSGENKLARFYAIAGIPRATTTEEDTQIKAYLMSQGV